MHPAILCPPSAQQPEEPTRANGGGGSGSGGDADDAPTTQEPAGRPAAAAQGEEEGEEDEDMGNLTMADLSSSLLGLIDSGGSDGIGGIIVRPRPPSRAAAVASPVSQPPQQQPPQQQPTSVGWGGYGPRPLCSSC